MGMRRRAFSKKAQTMMQPTKIATTEAILRRQKVVLVRPEEIEACLGALELLKEAKQNFLETALGLRCPARDA